MKINTKTTLLILSFSLILIGCGNDSDNTNPPAVNDTRFYKMTMMDQNVLRDTKTGLEWIEGNNKPSIPSGCNPQPSGQTEAEIKSITEQFCQDLNFAGHNDWRVAIATEHKEFIIAMKDAGKTPFYANPACPRLIAEEANGSIQTVNTHNSNPVGEILPWTKLNAGIKCVRKF